MLLGHHLEPMSEHSVLLAWNPCQSVPCSLPGATGFPVCELPSAAAREHGLERFGVISNWNQQTTGRGGHRRGMQPAEIPTVPDLAGSNRCLADGWWAEQPSPWSPACPIDLGLGLLVRWKVGRSLPSALIDLALPRISLLPARGYAHQVSRLLLWLPGNSQTK